MPTAMYLHDELADISLGTNNINKAGAAVAWRARYLANFVGDVTNVTATVASVNGPTNGLETGNPVNEWISDPLAAAVTISGTITFNICGLESNAMANAGLGVVVQRLSNVGAVVSTIVDSVQGTELGTANARRTWTATPTSTAMAKGDRLRVRVYFDDAGGTMVTGYTLTLTYDGTNAAVGDSNVTFAETLTFMSVPSPVSTPTQNTQFVTGALLRDAEYFDSLWVLSTSAGILTSADPTANFSLVPTTASDVHMVRYDGTTYVAVGSAGILTSSSISGTWSQSTIPSLTGTLQAVAYGNGVWVVGTSAGEIMTATNPAGIWTIETTPFTGFISEVRYANGVWVAVGAAGELATATDPTGTWTLRTVPITVNLGAVIYGDGVWVAVSSSNIMTATDPTGTWTQHPTTFSNLGAAKYANDVWIVGSSSSQLYYAYNPTSTWTALATPVGTGSAIAYNNGTWLFTSNTVVSTASDAATIIYPTSVVSDIADQGASVTEYTAWINRGNG